MLHIESILEMGQYIHQHVFLHPWDVLRTPVLPIIHINAFNVSCDVEHLFEKLPQNVARILLQTFMVLLHRIVILCLGSQHKLRQAGLEIRVVDIPPPDACSLLLAILVVEEHDGSE